jgi:hypothetical protein
VLLQVAPAHSPGRLEGPSLRRHCPGIIGTVTLSDVRVTSVQMNPIEAAIFVSPDLPNYSDHVHLPGRRAGARAGGARGQANYRPSLPGLCVDRSSVRRWGELLGTSVLLAFAHLLCSRVLRRGDRVLIGAFGVTWPRPRLRWCDATRAPLCRISTVVGVERISTNYPAPSFITTIWATPRAVAEQRLVFARRRF